MRNLGTLELGGTTQTIAFLNLAGGTLQHGNLNALINSSGGIIDSLGGNAVLTILSGVTVWGAFAADEVPVGAVVVLFIYGLIAGRRTTTY